MAETIKRAKRGRVRLSDSEIDRQVDTAQRRENRARSAGLRAKSVRYDERTERVVLELTNGIALAFPASLVRGLARATAAQRAEVALSPSGSGVIWEELDADISVPGIVASTFGRQLAARTLGQAGGKVRSRAKTRAARANGAKGGRPRKH